MYRYILTFEILRILYKNIIYSMFLHALVSAPIKNNNLFLINFKNTMACNTI